MVKRGGRRRGEGGGGREENEEGGGWGLKQANSAYLQGERGVELGVGWQRSSTAAETGKHSRKISLHAWYIVNAQHKSCNLYIPVMAGCPVGIVWST